MKNCISLTKIVAASNIVSNIYQNYYYNYYTM